MQYSEEKSNISTVNRTGKVSTQTGVISSDAAAGPAEMGAMDALNGLHET